MTSENKAISKEMFSAWEEWWYLTGSEALMRNQEQGLENGVECDAFAAGAEWMRGECERIATAQAQEDMANYAEDNNFGAEAVAEQIKTLGRNAMERTHGL